MESLPITSRARTGKGLGAIRIAPLLALCAACGPKTLEGSLGAIMDLTYDQVTAGQDSDTVAVTFIHSRGAAQDTVLKVGARLVGLTALTNTAVNLAETFPDGSQRGGLSRNVVNDPRTTFPPIARGQLLLKNNVVSGQQVSGSFNVTFALGTDAASGRTVFADFKASVP